MSTFQKLFGIEASEVRDTCVLLPMANRDILSAFGVRNFFRGKLYRGANFKEFTLVHTGLGAPLTADAVLYLKETPCKNVILFGSCGSVGGLDIGELILPEKCFANESFTQMLLNRGQELTATYPDKDLLEAFYTKSAAYKKGGCPWKKGGSLEDKEAHLQGIKRGVCLTVSSLKLEEDRVESFKAEAVDVVDMECSAFFSAAHSIGRRAFSLFYVADVIKEKPFYEVQDLKDKNILASCVKSSIYSLCRFIKEDLRKS